MDRMPLKQLMKYFVNHPVPPIGAMITPRPADERPGILPCHTMTMLVVGLFAALS
jgi:hypothetical protein